MVEEFVRVVLITVDHSLRQVVSVLIAGDQVDM